MLISVNKVSSACTPFNTPAPFVLLTAPCFKDKTYYKPEIRRSQLGQSGNVIERSSHDLKINLNIPSF